MFRAKYGFAIVGMLLFLVVLLVVGLWLRSKGANQGAIDKFTTTQWKQMKVPPILVNGKARDASLQSVLAFSKTNIWSVGEADEGLVEHYDGHEWKRMQVGKGSLKAIAATSTHDLWIVGSQEGAPLVLHGDGVSWERMQLPEFSMPCYLSSLVVRSSKNVWVTGWTQNNGSQSALIMHWDGVKWQIAPLPDLGKNASSLASMSAISNRNIWAVGSANGMELILHWNGKLWQQVAAPRQSGSKYHIDGASLKGVAALTAKDVWAVGSWSLSGGGDAGGDMPMTIHWDGKEWKRVAASGPEGKLSTLNSIVALSRNDIWAAGSFVDFNARLSRIYTLHWNGKNWMLSIWPRVYGEAPSGSAFYSGGIARVAGRSVVIVGAQKAVTQNPPIGDGMTRDVRQPLILITDDQES